MLTIGDKHLRKRYVYPNNISDVYLGTNHIWPYITSVVSGNWNVTLTASSMIIPATGSTVTLTSIATRQIVTTWVHYEGTTSNQYATTQNETATTTLTTTIGTITDNKLIVSKNPNNTDRTIVVTATYEGVTKTLEIIQQGKQVSSVGDWDLTVSANPMTISSTGGTPLITISAIRNVCYTDGTCATETGNPVVTSTGAGSFSNSIVTFGANSSTSSRTHTVTATIDGITKSVTVTQEGGS
jgi:hypothetical protein